MAARLVHDQDDGLSRVRFTYREAGPLVVTWDGATYRWWTDNRCRERLPADPEEAARCIAAALGAQAPEHPGRTS